MIKIATDLFQLKILVKGKPVQEYHKNDRTFVEGRPGSNFSLMLKNLTNRRILVHATVDGLSVMTGKEASRLDNGRGYILHPYQEEAIPGWRLDDEAVARFFFAGDGDSYSEKTGKGLDKGVVACAVWEEKVVEQPTVTYRTKGIGGYSKGGGRGCGQSIESESNYELSSARYSVESSSYNGGQQTCSGSLGQQVNCAKPTRSVSTQNLGTGFGDKTQHQVSKTTFTADTDEPAAIAVVYYDDYEGLRAQGIKLPKRIRPEPQLTRPNPFPKDTNCIPPKGWRS